MQCRSWNRGNNLKAFIDTITLCAPGLVGWENSRSVLNGTQELNSSELEKYKPSSLPKNEQRRASDTVRLAFRIGEEIKQQTGDALDDCASVFASSGGDYSIIHQICETLCTEEKFISPTRFHNSVHNAPSGYWAIATGSHQTSVSLAAYDDTFIYGLLEAMTIVKTDQTRVLLIAYDILPPHPLCEARKITSPFAVGMLLSPNKSASSQYEIQFSTEDSADPSVKQTLPGTTALSELFFANPIARSIPVLELIASKEKGDVFYQTGSGRESMPVILNLNPC